MATPSNQPRGLGWLPDVPSIKDYTASTLEVSTLLEKTAISSRMRAASTKGGGRASAAAAAPAFSPTVDLRAFGILALVGPDGERTNPYEEEFQHKTLSRVLGFPPGAEPLFEGCEGV